VLSSYSLLRWICWLALFALGVLLLLHATSRETEYYEWPTASRPSDSRLFHWWTKGGWVRDIALRGSHGAYFFRDEHLNVGALALLRVTGVSPGISDATQEHATLFTATPYEVMATASRDTLVVILPDLTKKHFAVSPGAVIEIDQRLIRAMQRPAGTFSVVEEVYRYAVDVGEKDLWSFLESYWPIHDVESRDSAE